MHNRDIVMIRMWRLTPGLLQEVPEHRTDIELYPSEALPPHAPPLSNVPIHTVILFQFTTLTIRMMPPNTKITYIDRIGNSGNRQNLLHSFLHCTNAPLIYPLLMYEIHWFTGCHRIDILV